MSGVPIARLLITDKRSDGHVLKSAWGLDFPMRSANSAQRSGDGFTPPEWYCTGVIPVPDLNAVMLDYSWGSSDMDLDQWIVDSGLWREVQPPGFGVTWLKAYDAAADTYQALLSQYTLPKAASWGLRFLRTRAPVDQSYPVFTAVTLNALGTERWCLYLPHDGSGYPELLYSDDCGVSWYTLDWFPAEEALRWCADAIERPAWVSCLSLPDHLIIQLGDTGLRWVYYEPGLEIPEGHLLVETQGGQMACHLDQLTFASPGTIEYTDYIDPPAFLNDEASDTVEVLSQEPDNTAVVAEMVSDANGLYPSATLTSNGDRTPLLFEIQATRPAKHAIPVTTTLFDSAGADTGVLESAEFYCAERGSWFKATLRTDGSYAFGGNEKASLAVALNAAVPTYTTQVTGYLETPVLTREGRDAGSILLQLSARDRFCRLHNKCGYLLPSFAGWTFQDAFTWLFHECAGLPETELALDAGASGYYYECPLQTLILQFDQTMTVDRIADALAAAAGRRWGINRLGQIWTVALGTEIYDGTPEFTIDEDTVTEADVCFFIEKRSDIFALRNRILCLGRDANGREQVTSWRWTESMSDPNCAAFIGDEWTAVIHTPDGGRPAMTAQFGGSELMQYQRLLKWQTTGKQDLFPGHYVKVDAVANIDVPAGTVFKILEKHGTVRASANELEFTTEFIGATL